MKTYKIKLDYGADLLQVCEYDESETKEEILERVTDGDYDILEDQTFTLSSSYTAIISLSKG